jgi:riboflavin kinase/FMN adenylyltransferase
MIVHRFPSATDPLPRGGVVTIGNFDGVHRGHQMLLGDAVERARRLGVAAVAVTFEPHPEKVLRPGSGLRLVTTPRQRAQLLERCGIGELVELRFDRELAATAAETFARDTLFGRLAPREIRLGANFRFGTNRVGDVAFLAKLGPSFGCAVHGAVPLTESGEVISTTRVRQVVAAGDVALARRLLGRPFHVDGAVREGARRGRLLGFPTLNIEVENELLPAPGVYVGAVQLAGETAPRAAVTNVGIRPTVEVAGPLVVESHVLGFDAEAYGREVRLFFVERLRDEQRFASTAALSEQIARDVAAAGAWHDRHAGWRDEAVLR